MTERLYYTDSVSDRRSTPVSSSVGDVDGRTGVVLDRTAFYPTSGGQPFDTGTLGGARVVDVVDETTARSCTSSRAKSGPASGWRSEGRLGTHRLGPPLRSHAAAHRPARAVGGVRSASAACGPRASTSAPTTSTIDLARELTPAEIAAPERCRQRVVWEDRPVTIRFVDADGGGRAAAAQGIDARPARCASSTSRTSTCRPAAARTSRRTGAIGIIAVSGWERFRGGTRLEFRCGVRALQRAPAAARHRRGGSRPAVDRRRTICRRRSSGSRRTSKDLAPGQGLRTPGSPVFEADALAAHAGGSARRSAWSSRRAGRRRERHQDDRAERSPRRPGHVAVLLTAASPASIVVARAADVPPSTRRAC